ncbi:hypothetical protein OSTOST_14590, partial [Ostertagia ostertagi]
RCILWFKPALFEFPHPVPTGFKVCRCRNAFFRFVWCGNMIRSKEVDTLKHGLRDALKMLESTPLFEQCEESYMKAIKEAEKLDVQSCFRRTTIVSYKDLLTPNSTGLRLEKLMKQYEEAYLFRCASSEAVGSNADTIAKLRARHPEAVESDEPQATSSNAETEEEMRVVEVVRKLRDPLGGGQIKDPVKSKHCGHVYDRKTLQEYIDGSKARRAMFYQCPRLCT